MRKKALAFLGLMIWLILVIGFMLLAKTLDLEIFFVLWLIGTLVIAELASDASANAAYMRNLRYVIACGVFIFGIIVALKILEILNA
ncbi:MAG: hypothetical protein APR55_03275 [Methanolinea sp. SDB]|nr:MAG: hypothetical protein APR55_03275 [Methanolinea sp. SDB]